jgi:hypothetical protein
LAWAALVALLSLPGCTSFESEYEKGVYDYEPLYCYQTLGGVDCHRKPHQRDATRLVNYYGPAPSKYKLPKPPKEIALRAPPKVSTAEHAERVASPPDHLSASADARDAGDTATSDRGGKGEAAAEQKSEWKEWLPLVSVAFGALQVVAAFAL